MGNYIIRRLLLYFPTLILISMFTFVIMRLIPGDPALIILMGPTNEGTFSQEQLDELRAKLGTDKNLVIQYWDWISGTMQGDFGESVLYEGISIGDELKLRFPVNLELAILAVIISFVLGVPIGVVTAMGRDTWIDYAGKIFTISGISVPGFWFAILMVYFMTRFWGWLPPLIYVHIWEDPWTNFKQVIFPAFALGFRNVALMARLQRSTMLEVLQEDFVRTARAKGLSEKVVLFRHALKNAILPVLTVSGLEVAGILGGSIIIEVIFILPGIGQLTINSIGIRDYNIIQAVVLLAAILVLTVNLVVDLLYGWLNPRIRYA